MKIRFEVEQAIENLIGDALDTEWISEEIYADNIEVSLPGPVVIDITYTMDMERVRSVEEAREVLICLFDGFKVKNVKEVL